MSVSDLKRLQKWMPWMRYQGRKVPSLDGITLAQWKKDRDNVQSIYIDAMMRCVDNDRLEGVGIEIPYGLAVIDLDHCINVTGDLNDVAKEIVERFNSYTEFSPSGTGLHIITAIDDLSDYPKLKANFDNQSVEVLLPGNFVTFSGDSLFDGKDKIYDRTDLVLELYHEAGVEKRKPVNAITDIVRTGNTAYGDMALEKECSIVRQAIEGTRSQTLYTAAKHIGGLIPAGEVDENRAVSDLTYAGRATGLDEDKIRQEIADGIRAGKMHPRPPHYCF